MFNIQSTDNNISNKATFNVRCFIDTHLDAVIRHLSFNFSDGFFVKSSAYNFLSVDSSGFEFLVYFSKNCRNFLLDNLFSGIFAKIRILQRSLFKIDFYGIYVSNCCFFSILFCSRLMAFKCLSIFKFGVKS